MLELTSAGRPVRLSPGTSVQLEYHSPLFDEEVVQGSFSYSFAVPAPPNGPLYGFPERLDADAAPGAALPAELALFGLPLLVGTQRVRSASSKRYSVNLTGGLSALAAQLSARAIHTFGYGGVRHMPPGQPWPGVPVGGLAQVPGWVAHANEVVRQPEAYDYVFAPVRVESFYEPAPAPDPAGGGSAPVAPALPPVVLNPWLANNTAALQATNGLPLGGTFAAYGYKGYQRLVVPAYNLFDPESSQPYRSADGELLRVYGPLACPFPKLRYVLRSIFEEACLQIDEPNFLPGELGDLVIVSPADVMRTERDAAGVVQCSFALADALPNVTVAGLLQALRRTVGLVVLIDEADRRVRTALLRDLVAAPVEVVPDLTAYLAGPAEVEIAEASALKLVYATDPDDLLTANLLQAAPDPATLSPAVETLADLPATAALGAAAETRLVRAEGSYFRSQVTSYTVNPAPLNWTFLAAALEGLEVGGTGGEEYAQGMAFTQLGRAPFQQDPTTGIQLDPQATAWMEVPAMSRPGYEPGNISPEATPRPAALRLLFWRGLQPASDGNSLYPLLTPLATNQAGQAVGSLSLRLAGPAGTYAMLLRGWLEVKRRGALVKQPLRLSVLDLARLDLSRKVRLDGVEYLVRKLSVAVPLRKPAMVELVRV